MKKTQNNTLSEVCGLLEELIRCPSITPNDAGCQTIIAERLKNLGFSIESMPFGNVSNLWARHGTGAPLMVFAGHTDVVPPGSRDAWHSDPFIPTLRNDFLYGRGAADMKSGLAAMIVATEAFIQKNPNYKGSIAFLITSDEEGQSIDGTRQVVKKLVERQEKMDYCIVGEASSENSIGDQIRVGRRGSLSGKLIISGKQGHVAFPEKARNPIHLFAPALKELTTESWDNGNMFFPATTFQISNIHGGTGANNVIPGTLEVKFNFRFSTASTAHALQTRVNELLARHGLEFNIVWDSTAQPFLTQQGKLLQVVKKSIQELTHLETVLSTGGGTSDGRFIAPTGTEVIELGPCNATVHQANECIKIRELEKLTAIYERILEYLFK